jgi:hypothetical protein
LYLCGPVTRDENYRSKFLEAGGKVFNAGFHPVNPAAAISAGAEWGQAMREAVGLMLRCDGVALLPGWEDSRGARIEERLAREVGITVKPLEEWVSGR